MKAVLKVSGMNDSTDIREIQNVISEIEGIIASEVALKKKEVTIIYNNMYVELESIIGRIEDLGYTVI
ncbi:heavy-metal-associated domain-containing protein [Clostridium sp.]|uniref:heavy-metal-associated domain-containing protein n=1 Tax=Clostridium sp. TaxID=1506 RepID=UPI002A917D44|nr:heavy-metal-associated domain-containing protein [Clostridium sp.]MDY6013044.1 heavy-metal-associated domain-containing protein [Clostridium sp.]